MTRRWQIGDGTTRTTDILTQGGEDRQDSYWALCHSGFWPCARLPRVRRRRGAWDNARLTKVEKRGETEMVHYFEMRYSWCNSYRHRKWTRPQEFKSWTRLIAFHITLIPLGKVWIQLFSLQLWVNSREGWVLQPLWGKPVKLCLKLTLCHILLELRGLVNMDTLRWLYIRLVKVEKQGETKIIWCLVKAERSKKVEKFYRKTTPSFLFVWISSISDSLSFYSFHTFRLIKEEEKIFWGISSVIFFCYTRYAQSISVGGCPWG